jgi:type IV pilus assembly protein PilE
MRFSTTAARARAAGFTLIELMMVVAVIAILAAIAVPTYSSYVMRSKIIDATSKLGDLRTQMEKYFMDNRTYLNGANCGVQPIIVAYNADPGRNFDFSCPAFTATTYTLRADGRSARGMGAFAYTVNETNAKSTVSVYSGWSGGGSTCWVLKSDGSC